MTSTSTKIPAVSPAEYKAALKEQQVRADAKKITDQEAVVSEFDAQIEDSRIVASALRGLALELEGNSALSLVQDALIKTVRFGEDKFYYRRDAVDRLDRLKGNKPVETNEI